MIKEMDITLHPDTELDDEQCTALRKWMAHRDARGVTLRKADFEVPVDARVEVEAASELAPASPPENAAQPISRDDFLKTMFAHTGGPVYTCSLPNERGDRKQAGERHVITRKPNQIDAFIENWDQAGRGLFFCVGTVKPGAKRRKENIAETIFLHADIDFKNVDLLPTDKAAAVADVLRQLARLKYPPSVIMFSGGGLHAYWLLTEKLDTQTEMAAHRDGVATDC
jgi:hypothetical protein